MSTFNAHFFNFSFSHLEGHQLNLFTNALPTCRSRVTARAVALATTSAMSRLMLCCALLLACGDDDEEVDAGTDAFTPSDASDDTTDAEADVPDVPDAFMRLPPPECSPPPAVDPPACGSGPVARNALIPGAAGSEHDAELAAQARIHDRGFHAIAALFTGVNTEIAIPDNDDRETVRAFLEDTDEWDLVSYAGVPVESMVSWSKVAGAYGGVGAAADAFRYAVLRDEGAACNEVERAREHVLAAMDALHRATAITGVRGVIARGYIRRDLPGGSFFEDRVVPLFDDEGNPLPEEKNNGTWRVDESGDYPEYVWEDSCSRDMLIGWVIGMAAVWEVVANDPMIDDARKATLQDDALALAESLMVVGEDGYDLEIPDADGRLTFHAYLNEAAIDRVYVPGFTDNGQHATMALGIMAALARVSGDEGVQDYVYNDLIRSRGLHEIVREHIGIIDFGVVTNFSNYNMTFDGAWLSARYLCDPEALSVVREGIDQELYNGGERAPAILAQSFFDVVYASARGSATIGQGVTADASIGDAMGRGLQTLRDMPAPYWASPRIQCDEAEIEALLCTLEDGSTVELLGYVGRNDALIAAEAIPMRTRPPSNFHWRSDPHRVNADGSDNVLYPAVDFRFAYWMGRYLTVE